MIVNFSTQMREAGVTLYNVNPIGAAERGRPLQFYYQDFLKGVSKPSQALIGQSLLAGTRCAEWRSCPLR